ncbi:Hypothetical_protein [Hexamita inflata]|uniref:Hypothetical_protein n=1 Tax=Hexamita inflata TaxID=28002 RepID=A0AA86PCL3_9EUKA|nr:Hypothetical protein HINF_LOCUS21414 [Hexamita inflata]
MIWIWLSAKQRQTGSLGGLTRQRATTKSSTGSPGPRRFPPSSSDLLRNRVAWASFHPRRFLLLPSSWARSSEPGSLCLAPGVIFRATSASCRSVAAVVPALDDSFWLRFNPWVRVRLGRLLVCSSGPWSGISLNLLPLVPVDLARGHLGLGCGMRVVLGWAASHVSVQAFARVSVAVVGGG